MVQVNCAPRAIDNKFKISVVLQGYWELAEENLLSYLFITLIVTLCNAFYGLKNILYGAGIIESQGDETDVFASTNDIGTLIAEANTKINTGKQRPGDTDCKLDAQVSATNIMMHEPLSIECPFCEEHEPRLLQSEQEPSKESSQCPKWSAIGGRVLVDDGRLFGYDGDASPLLSIGA